MRRIGPVEECRTSHACRRAMSGGDNMAVWATVLMASALLLIGCHSAPEPQQNASQGPSQASPQPDAPQPAVVETVEPAPPQATVSAEPSRHISLFDGETLDQWEVTDFGGQGDVYVKDGAIHMEMGSYMTGITWTGPVIRMNYEITLDAMRVQGNDFFCALTFPAEESHCTLVLGGWGGSVCGLSNIDYFDASENETTRLMSFKTGTWYHVRLRVTPGRIQAWLDDEDLVDVETTGHKIDTRPEVDLSQPLGVATWMTAGAVRNIRVKALSEEPQ